MRCTFTNPATDAWTASLPARGLRLLTLALGLCATVATAHPFGVQSSLGKRPDMPGYAVDLNAQWVRVNAALDGTDADLRPFLEAGLNLVVTFHNADPANVDTTYGAIQDWPNAGFPFKTKTRYQQDVRDYLTPLLPWLAQGRQIWVQAENEIGDVSAAADGTYWRGTTDQYLVLLAAFTETVHALHPSLVVVLTSFASNNLDVAINPADPKYAYQTSRMTRLLTEGQYDAADGHFYGCIEDMAARIGWLTMHLPAGKRWIATEISGPDSTCPTTPHTWRDDLAQFEQVAAQQVAPRLAACANGGGAICLWFSLFDLTGEVDQFNHLGVLDGRVSPPRQKPAYAALQSFIATNGAITAPVIEFYRAALDHYFMTAAPAEIADLDSGRTHGWSRTGLTFNAWTRPGDLAGPVCRFYMPPAFGDSHFYSASAAECADVQRKFPGYVYESPQVFDLALPNVVTGACPASTVPVYRVWNQRLDSSHRYVTDLALRDQMVASGYLAEGYGPDAVTLCAPL